MAWQRNVRGGKPSPYPRILFHALRSAQLLSSIVVSGIMCYFMYYLRKYSWEVSYLEESDSKYHVDKEHFSIPWTFIVVSAHTPRSREMKTRLNSIQLFLVSLATVVILTLTILLYNFRYLSPRFNLALNGSITFFWALGLGLLSWSVSSSHVLEKTCTVSGWGGALQAGVCRDYKVLWSMTLIGT